MQGLRSRRRAHLVARCLCVTCDLLHYLAHVVSQQHAIVYRPAIIIMHFRGKSVVLTGAGSGIGRVLVLEFTRRGCLVTARCPLHIVKSQLCFVTPSPHRIQLFS